jgi:hypothetical protein
MQIYFIDQKEFVQIHRLTAGRENKIFGNMVLPILYLSSKILLTRICSTLDDWLILLLTIQNFPPSFKSLAVLSEPIFQSNFSHIYEYFFSDLELLNNMRVDESIISLPYLVKDDACGGCKLLAGQSLICWIFFRFYSAFITG